MCSIQKINSHSFKKFKMHKTFRITIQHWQSIIIEILHLHQSIGRRSYQFFKLKVHIFKIASQDNPSIAYHFHWALETVKYSKCQCVGLLWMPCAGCLWIPCLKELCLNWADEHIRYTIIGKLKLVKSIMQVSSWLWLLNSEVNLPKLPLGWMMLQGLNGYRKSFPIIDTM